MTNPLGVDDFFALEAGEYLDRLATMVGGPTAPAADDLVRYTRALRGSALMASQNAIARAAGGLESLVRAYRDGKRPWDAVAPAAQNGVGEIRTLVGNIRRWTAADTAAAERLAATLEGAAGAAPTPRPAPTPTADFSDAGVRAFVAREGALVASALDQAAQALRADPTARDPLQSVVRRMQPLRGLAALGDLPPLPELLEGVDGALSDLQRGAVAPSVARELFEVGAQAISRAARDVAQSGRPDPEALEARRFADLLLRTRTPAEEIVPVESLFYHDGQPDILQRGTAPRGAPGLGAPRVELVSRGEHLCQVSAELARAVSPTQRDLQLLSLSADLRALAEGVSGELGSQLAAFADFARDAIATGRIGRVPHEFTGYLRQAGELLRSWSGGDAEPALLEQLTGLARAMLLLGRGTPARPAPRPVEPLPEAEPVELPVVPIEALAPSEPAPEPEAEAVPAEVAEGGADLAESYDTYARLMAEQGLGPPSLELLLRVRVAAAAAPAPPIAPPSPPPAPRPVAPAPAAPVPTATVPPERVAAEPAVVDIAELCYRGRAALQRAAMLKVQIRSAVDRDEAVSAVQPLLDELMDLVELALVED
jgi:hypothetical protein